MNWRRARGGVPGSTPHVTGLLAPFFLLVTGGRLFGLLAAVVGLVRKEWMETCVVGLLLNATLLASMWMWQPIWTD